MPKRARDEYEAEYDKGKLKKVKKKKPFLDKREQNPFDQAYSFKKKTGKVLSDTIKPKIEEKKKNEF